MRMTDEGDLPQGKVFVCGSPMKVGTVYQNRLWYNIYTRTVGDAGPYDLTTLSTQTSLKKEELAEPNFCKFSNDTAPKANLPHRRWLVLCTKFICGIIYTDRRGRRSLRVCDVWHNMRGRFVNRPYGACHFDFCKPH